MEEMRGGGLEMLASLCSPERELSCRFSGMGCPGRRTQMFVSETKGRQSGCSHRRAKGHRREQGLAVSPHEAPSHTVILERIGIV